VASHHDDERVGEEDAAGEHGAAHHLCKHALQSKCWLILAAGPLIACKHALQMELLAADNRGTHDCTQTCPTDRLLADDSRRDP
jgi:hypothetical protein